MNAYIQCGSEIRPMVTIVGSGSVIRD
jgi:hypothetical protein